MEWVTAVVSGYEGCRRSEDCDFPYPPLELVAQRWKDSYLDNLPRLVQDQFEEDVRKIEDVLIPGLSYTHVYIDNLRRLRPIVASIESSTLVDSESALDEFVGVFGAWWFDAHGQFIAYLSEKVATATNEKLSKILRMGIILGSAHFESDHPEYSVMLKTLGGMVVEDGVVDETERSFLKSAARAFSLEPYFLAIADPEIFHGDMVRGRLYQITGSEGGAYTFFVNTLEGDSAMEEVVKDPLTSLLTGRPYLDDDPAEYSPVCFSAALCYKGEECEATSDPEKVIDRDYRMLDPTHERVQRGDLLLYGTVQSWKPKKWLRSITVSTSNGEPLYFVPLHASLVDEVDLEGMPKRAIGKMGRDDAPVKLHSPFHVDRGYGPLIAVFRNIKRS